MPERPKESPDHHDAELVLKLYELRREPVMRAARQALNEEYWPKTVEAALAPTNRANSLNAAWRQVTGYWEMVFGMARHGIVHADYLVENNTEGLFLFVRVEPFLAEIRATGSPRMFQHCEWVAKETEMGRQVMANLRSRFGAAAASGTR